MEILVDKKTIFRIMRYKKELENRLDVRIKIGKGRIFFEGEANNEFIAEKVFEAINAGFSIDKALLLLREDFVFEKINIKNFTRHKNLQEVRARIIGTKGKTLQLLTKLSNCFIELKDNELYIIGEADDIEDCMQALRSLVGGAKQGNVYKYLEKARRRKKEEDLGLR